MNGEWLVWGGAVAGAYLLGSIPIGFLMARAKGIDIRAHGSGNIGATNIGRVLGKRAGYACMACDMLKGFAPTLGVGLASGAIESWSRLSPLTVLEWTAIAVAAVLGHMFPPWLRFRGGKGVATAFGALMGVFPVMSVAALGALVVWLVSVRITRQVGISSCIAAASLPAWVYAWMFVAREAGLLGPPDPHTGRSAVLPDSLVAYGGVATGLAAIVIWKHRGNIARTLAGTERKIGERTSAPPPAAAGSPPEPLR